MRKALIDSFLWRGFYFATTLILNICIARIYQAAESGWIYFISNNFYLVLLIGGLGLEASLTYHSASNKITDEKLASISIAWSAVVVLFTLAVVAGFIATGYVDGNYLFILFAGAAYTFGISLTNYFTALFYAKHNFITPNIMLCAANILLVAMLGLYASGVTGLNTQHLLYIYFALFVVQGLGVAVLYCLKYAPPSGLQWLSPAEVKTLTRFALIALSANIAYYLIYRVDYLFVEAYCEPAALGNYVQVSKMGQLLLIIPTIISGAVYPQAAMSNSNNVVDLINRSVVLFLLLFTIIFIVSALVAQPVFTWVFGATFNQMYQPFLLLIPGILFLSIHMIIAAFFGGRNKPSNNTLSTTAGLVVVLAGDALFIKKYGINAAAVISTIGYGTAFCFSLFMFMKATGTHFNQIFSKEAFKLTAYKTILQKRPANTI